MRLDALARGLALLPAVKTKRSSGVSVTGAVYRHIAAGNAARDRYAWSDAATAYGAALERAPELFHIWIQRGHALKEAGDLPGAVANYERAQELRPESADPHLHLGHAAKLRGDIATATRHYFDAARNVPPATDAIAELRALTMKGAKIDMHELRSLFGEPRGATAPRERPAFEKVGIVERRPEPPHTDKADTRPCVVFDVSDLIAYFNHSRTPSGIQRVQLETLQAALDDATGDVRICAVHEIREEWIEIPPVQFLDLCRLNRSGGEADWSLAFTELTVLMNVAPPFVFPRGASLVNLGTSWWIANYFMYVRRAKQEAGIRYIPFIHDLIPLVRSDLCPPLLVRDFTTWIVSVFDHADFYLVNSQSTMNDLAKVGAYLGRPIESSRIEVVRLDAVPGKSPAPGDIATPRPIGLPRGSYVLFVSTIEPRKNHLLAFEAWSKLLDRYGARRLPKLVCVGNSGWMNEPIHDHLKARPDLQAKVQILSNVSDEYLDQLYENCLFTLYPSNYEGWGLPVTESLSHGKVPLCSRISSIPEAGGDFADYFSLESRAELIESIGRLVFDAEYRRSRERHITGRFSPRSWDDIAGQILGSVSRWANADTDISVETPIAEPGRYYSLSRHLAPRLWPGLRSTDGFRSGFNWWGRDPWGCWTKPGGGTLRFTVPDATKPHRLYLDLLGMPHIACELRIDANGREGLEEALFEPNERRWLSVELPGLTAPDQPMTVDLQCTTFEDLTKTVGSETRMIAIGVRGFYLCEAGNVAARMALMEAITLSTIDSLSANRPPADFMSLQTYMEGGALV